MINWDIFIEVWDSFREFLDTLFLWLQFLFDGNATWPPEELPEVEIG